jgi:hypothetical protein
MNTEEIPSKDFQSNIEVTIRFGAPDGVFNEIKDRLFNKKKLSKEDIDVIFSDLKNAYITSATLDIQDA